MNNVTGDPIFSSLTRPQMVGGVTYSFAVFNLVVTVEAFLITKSFWSLLIAVLVHGIGALGCVNDPRFFDLWITRVRRCPRVKNYNFWSANSYRP